jgi:hypothetical protein
MGGRRNPFADGFPLSYSLPRSDAVGSTSSFWDSFNSFFPQKVCQLTYWHLSNRGATDRLPFSIPRVQRKETDCLDRSRKCPRNVAVKECRASFDTFSPMLLTSPHLDALSRQTLRTALVDGCCCCWLIAPCVVNGTVDLEYNSLLFESV